MKEKTYRTSDLNIAAYLKSNFKLNIEKYDEDKTGRVFFVFKTNNIDIEESLSDYFNGKAVCNINDFIKEHANLRLMIRNLQEN